MQLVIAYSGKAATLLTEHPFWTVLFSGTFIFLTLIYILHTICVRQDKPWNSSAARPLR